MVELFTSWCFARYPSAACTRLRSSRTWRLPTSAGVERTSRAFHPIRLLEEGFGPNPAGGFARRCRAHLLRLSRPRARHLRARGLSRSPCFAHFSQRHGIECWDWTPGVTASPCARVETPFSRALPVPAATDSAGALLQEASLALDKPLSRHPALRTQHCGGWLVRLPFSDW